MSSKNHKREKLKALAQGKNRPKYQINLSEKWIFRDSFVPQGKIKFPVWQNYCTKIKRKYEDTSAQT